MDPSGVSVAGRSDCLACGSICIAGVCKATLSGSSLMGESGPWSSVAMDENDFVRAASDDSNASGCGCSSSSATSVSALSKANGET